MATPQVHVPQGVNERAAELIQRFGYADAWRKQYDARAVEWYKLYVGHREASKIPGRSNLHIPRTYEQLDTLRARIVRSFFSQRPYLDFIAKPERGNPALTALNERKALVAAATVDEQLERNGILRLFYDYVTSFLVFPAAVMSVGWRFEQRRVRRRVPVIVGFEPQLDGTFVPQVAMVEQESEEVTWDDNELAVVDYFDFWPDPKGRDIDSSRFCFQREFMNEEGVEELLAVLEQAGSGETFDLNWRQLRGAAEGLEEGRTERLAAIGLAAETQEGHWAEEDEQGQRRGRMHEVLHYWEDDRHALIINRVALAYDGANPYWRHGKKPYVAASFDPLPNEFYGLSAVQIIEHLQHELNTHRNQRIDNVSMIINRMAKIRRSADIDETELISRPHGWVKMDDPERDLVWDAPPDVTASAYQEEAITKADMETAIATPAVVRGVEGQRGETATEVVTRNSNASVRFDVKIMLYETMGMKRLAMLMDMNNQQFIDSPRLVRLFGHENAAQWVQVFPGEIVGEFDYRPAGTNVDPAANKEVRRQQLSQMMQFLIETRNPFVDLYELTREWLGSFDVRNVEKFLIPREQVAAMMAAQAAQAGLQGGMASLGAMGLPGAGGASAPLPPAQTGQAPILAGGGAP